MFRLKSDAARFAGKTYLLVFAHPDDESYATGGSMAHYARHGARVVYICATRGEAGRRMGDPPFATRETLGEIREMELRAACAQLGAELILLGLPDKGVATSDWAPQRQRLAELIRAIGPDATVTFTHDGGSGHQDHIAMSVLTELAWRDAGGPGKLYWISNPDRFAAHCRVRGLDPERALRVRLPIERYWPDKVAALRQHRTQTEQEKWLWADPPALAERFRTHELFLRVAPAPLEADPGQPVESEELF